MGQANPYLTAHPLYLALGADNETRRGAYSTLFRTQLDEGAISDIRLAVTQSQPLGNARFYATTEAMTGQRREGRRRGGPNLQRDGSLPQGAEHGELPL